MPIREIRHPLIRHKIGLMRRADISTKNFRELAQYFKGGKPLILYVCGQSFNLLLTLIMAYIMFYKVFPEITAKI